MPQNDPTSHSGTLEPGDVVRLVLALNRAVLTPFTRNDWHGWAGATGQAHTVRFHQHDHRYLLDRLGMACVPDDYVTVILDEMGVSWNVFSPVNAYAWMVQVELQQGVHEPPTAEQFWETDGRRRYGVALDNQIAALPEAQRALVMACPEAARPHVMRGLLATAAEQAEPVTPETQIWVHPNELGQWEVRSDRYRTVHFPTPSVVHATDSESAALTWARNNLPGARLMPGAPPVPVEG